MSLEVIPASLLSLTCKSSLLPEISVCVPHISTDGGIQHVKAVGYHEVVVQKCNGNCSNQLEDAASVGALAVLVG